MGVQGARDAGQRGRDGKRQRLVARQVDAHALRGNFRVAYGDESAAGGRAQQVENGQRGADGNHEAQKIKLLAAVELPAEHVGRLDVRARVAAGDRLPARKNFLDDEAESQRGNAQVDALDAQRRQPDHQPHGGRQAGGAGQRDGKGYPGVGHHRLRVSPDPEKGRVAQREQAGEAGQQHQAQAGNRIDQDEGQLGQPVFGEQPGCGQQQQQQGAVPEDMAAVLGEIDVLTVVSLEDKTHVNLNFLAEFFAKEAIGFDHQHDQHHHIGGDVLDAVGRVKAGQ